MNFNKDIDNNITVHIIWLEDSGAICYVSRMNPIDETGLYATL